jgi:hypothetical protein
VLDGLDIGRCTQGAFTGGEPIVNGLVDHAAFSGMVREQLRLRDRHLLKTFVQHLHDPAMQLLSLTAQQRAIGRVLHQCVLEGVDCAALEDQPAATRRSNRFAPLSHSAAQRQ